MHENLVSTETICQRYDGGRFGFSAVRKYTSHGECGQYGRLSYYAKHKFLSFLEGLVGRDVTIREVGPREGFQTIGRWLPVEEKRVLIEALVETGVQEIEVCSFVRPDRLPHMADAEALCQVLPLTDDVRFYGLCLNIAGLERAAQCERLTKRGWIYGAIDPGFFESNYGSNAGKFQTGLSRWQEAFQRFELSFDGCMVSTAFGSNAEGRYSKDYICSSVERLLATLSNVGLVPRELSLADTMGWGSPVTVRAVCARLQALFPDIVLSLHLHDTRGLGIANAIAGLEAGVRVFESSVGGVGGCPFAVGASGNIATEDFLFACEAMGLSTGLSLERYVEAAETAERILGRENLNGRVYRVERALREDAGNSNQK